MLRSRKNLLKFKLESGFNNVLPTDNGFSFPQKDLSVYGGAVSILLKHERRPFLLFSPRVQEVFEFEEGMTKYGFIDISYKESIEFEKKSFSYFIDLLFFLTRMSVSPEYLTKIDSGSKSIFEYPFQYPIRRELKILHSTTGEIEFFLLGWSIAIQLFINAKDINANIEETFVYNDFCNSDSWINLFVNADDMYVEKEILNKFDFAERKLGNTSLEKDEIEILEAILDSKYVLLSVIEKKNNWEALYKAIGISIDDDRSRKEFVEYSSYVFGSKNHLDFETSNYKDFSETFVKQLCRLIDLDFYTATIGELLKKIHAEARFPIIPYYYLTTFDAGKNLKEHLVFPIWYTFSEHTQYQYEFEGELKSESSVLHALSTIKPIWEHEGDEKIYYWDESQIEASEALLKHYDSIERYYSDLSKPIIDREYYGKYILNSLKDKELRAMVGQIFLRNFAHNIGSHVASRCTNKEIKKRINQLYPNNINEIETSKEPAALLWLDHSSEILDRYEIDRNEFLAEYHLLPKNLMFFRDLVLPFCENTLLLDNIARSEHITYQTSKANRLKIFTIIDNVKCNVNYPKLREYYEDKKGDSNGKMISYPDNFPYMVESDIDLKEAFNKKEIIGNDIEICLPSEHTFFSILENFIRNAAKHNKQRLNLPDPKTGELPDLEIYIDITKNGSDYYKVLLYDNISLVSLRQLEKFDVAIQDTLIDEVGQVKRENLGLADIKINAHLLSNKEEVSRANIGRSLRLKAGLIEKDFSFVDDRDLKPDKDVFEPYQKWKHFGASSGLDANEKKYKFGYRFHFSKSKKVLWLRQTIDEVNRAKLEDNGIYQCVYTNASQFQKELPRSLAHFDFAIVEPDAVSFIKNDSNSLTPYEWDKLLTVLPFRVLVNVSITDLEQEKYATLIDLFNTRRVQVVDSKIAVQDFDEPDWSFKFLQQCWVQWLKRWLLIDPEKGIGTDRVHLYLYFEDILRAEAWDIVNVKSLIESTDGPFLFDVYHDGNKSDMDAKADEYNIAFDHHGQGIEKYSNTEDYLGVFDSISNSSYFHFDGTSQDFTTLATPPKHATDKALLAYRAIEAGLLRVVVLDERINEHINIEEIEKDVSKPKDFLQREELRMPNECLYDELLNWGKTFLVTNFRSSLVNPELVDENGGAIDNFMLDISTDKPATISNGLLDEKIKFYDALVIHRTYLDQVFKDIAEEQDVDIAKRQAEIMHALYEKFPNIIITSGGGAPHSMAFDYKFRNFSIISRNFAKTQSKLSLISIL